MIVPVHWRYATGVPKLIGVDVKAFIPLVIALFVRDSTWIGLAVLNLIFFGVIGYLGFTVDVTVRAVRHHLRGRLLPAKDFIYWKVFNRR